MVLDSQGIARVCRWRVEDGGYPEYATVAESLGQHGVDVAAMKRWLVELGDRVAELATMMNDEDVPPFVVQTLEPRVSRVAAGLKRVR
jgi:hypothetical protein